MINQKYMEATVEKRRIQVDPRFFDLALTALGEKGVVSVAESVEILRVMREESAEAAANALAELLSTR